MKPTLFTRDLKQGSFGLDVFKLQDLLEQFGYGDFTPTGYFGEKTTSSLMKFQLKNHIPPVGILGPQTREFINKIISSGSEILYFTAIGCLNTDASPNDLAPDEYGCAETVNAIHKKAFGFEIGGNLSTYAMYQVLQNDPGFMRVDAPRRGDIIISPTGYGNGRLSNGHVGIMSSETEIMSNNSYTGKFEQNYSLQKWRDRYAVLGGYFVAFFRKV